MDPRGVREPVPVLFLANVYPPENLIGSLRPFRFAKYLPGFGYRAHVLTQSPQPDPPPDSVEYVPQPQGRWRNLVSQLLFPFDDRIFWTAPAVRAAEAWLDATPAKVVFSTFPPVSGHLAALLLKRRRGLKWIADFRDPMRGNFGRRDRLLGAWIDAALERCIFRDADILVANTAAAAGFWKRRFPGYASKVRVIYNGFDPETAQLAAAAIPARPYQILLHAGSLYSRTSRLPRFLGAVQRALASGRADAARLRLHLVGDLEEEARVRADPAFQALTAAGVLHCTPVAIPADEVRAMMSTADYLLVFDRDSPEGILQLPAKVFEYIQVGRPVLAWTRPSSPLESILAASGIRHVCLYMDEPDETLAGKIEAFLRLPPDPRVPSDAYLREFGAVSQAGQLAGLCDELTAKESS